MGYNIEISFDMVKHANVSQMKREITDFALDSCCDHYYYLYEMEGCGTTKRNHCIIVVNFDDMEIMNCALFLKSVRKNKDLYIECIYDDANACKLIYASRYYQTTMNRDKAIKYNKFKRERSLSDNERTILDELAQKAA